MTDSGEDDRSRKRRRPAVVASVQAVDSWSAPGDGYREFRRRIETFENESTVAAAAESARVVACAMARDLKNSAFFRSELTRLTELGPTSYRQWCSAARMNTYEPLDYTGGGSDVFARLRLDVPAELARDIAPRSVEATAAAAAAAEDDDAIVNANDSTHGESLMLRLLALDERISELSATAPSQQQSSSTSFFSDVKTRAVCEYRLAHCLVRYIVQRCAESRVEEERAAANRAIAEREAHMERLTFARRDLTMRIERLSRSLTEEHDRVVRLGERESDLVGAMTLLERQIDLARDRVNQQAMLTAHHVIEGIRRDMEKLEERRNALRESAIARLSVLRTEQDAMVRRACKLLRRIRAMDANATTDAAAVEDVIPCDYTTLMVNARYFTDTAVACETSGALITVAANKAEEVMAIVENCSVVRRLLHNHALRQAIDDSRQEDAKHELYKRAYDQRLQSIASYGDAMYAYAKWRNCLVEATKNSILLPLRLIEAQYGEGGYGDGSRLADMTDDETTKLVRSITDAQKRQATWKQLSREQCRFVISMLHSVLAMKKKSANAEDVQNCRFHLPTTTELYDALAMEDRLESTDVTRSTVVVAAVAAAAENDRQLRDREIEWPRESKRAPYELLGLKFAALCACSPIPTSEPLLY